MAAKKKHRSVKEIESQTFLHSVHGGDLGSDATLIKVNDSEYAFSLRSDLEPGVAEDIQAEAVQSIKEPANNSDISGKIWLHGELSGYDVRFVTGTINVEGIVTLEEEAQEPSPESFTSLTVHVSISLPMPPKEVEPSDHLTEHIGDLQSQATLGSETNQRPSHYPHENVVFHVAQLQAEAQSQEKPPAGSGVIYERGRLTTVAEASRVTGIKLGTLYNHLNSGKLTERGRIIASAPGGGKVLIDLDELDSLPRRQVGRPKQLPESPSSKRSRGRPKKNP